MMKKYIVAAVLGLLIAAASAMQINGPLVGASLERLSAQPSTPNIGRIYYDTVAGSPKICDGTACTTIVTPAQMVTSLGYTPEDVANKSTAQLLGSSDLLYPSQHAVKVYVDTAFSTTVQTTLGAIDSAARTASGAAVTGQTLSLQTFDGTHPGEVPASGGGTTNYLRADGTWAAAPGSVASVTGTTPIASSGGANPAISLNSNGVTNTYLAQMAAHTYKGNNTGATANAIDVTNTQLTADLNLFSATLQGLVPSSGGGTTNFLRADGAWAAVASPLTFIDSITNSGGNVSLVNDTATPGASKYYGTDGTSTLGYFALPTGFTNPMTTLGDLMFENSVPAAARLAGNTSATKGFLVQTGTGTVSASPSWQLGLSSGDIPNNAASTSGNAATATALASAPTTCTSGQVPTGVDVHGNATGCAAPTVSINNDAQTELLSPNTLTFPNNKVTANGIGSARIDDGDNNLLANRSFEASTTTTNWTTVKNTGTSFAASTDSTNFHDGLKSVKLTATTATGCISQDVTPSVQLSGTNMEFGAWVKTSGTDVQVCAREGAATIGTCSVVPSTNQWTYVPVNYPGPASGSVGVSVCNTSASAPSETFNVDEAYVGEARNLSQVSQAQWYGSVSYPETTSCSWAATGTGAPANVSANASCSAPTVSGSLSAPGTKIPAIVLPNAGPGVYRFVAKGIFQASGNDNCKIRFSDGTNNTAIMSYGGNSAGVNALYPTVEGEINYTSPPAANTTVQLQLAAANTAGDCDINAGSGSNYGGLVISVSYLPTQSQLAINANQLSAPQTTVLTSGTGTYTVANGVNYLELEMVGGGGGGAAGGTAQSVAPTAGNNTTFGTNTAGGGSAGTFSSGASGGAGGTPTVGSGWTCVGNGMTGATGGGGASTLTSIQQIGSFGGSSYFGGAGQSELGKSGGSAVTNSGSGGASGGSSASSGYPGSAGGSGAYLHCFISTNSSAWASSFSYAVGASAAGGTSSANGYNGGSGAAGQIRVTASYSSNFPVLVGSVTSSGAGQYHTEGATVSCGSSSSVTSSSGPWLTIANILSNSCAISFTSGEFSAAPWCTLGSVDGNSSLTYNSKLSSQATTSGMSIMTTYTNGSSVSVASPATVNISCFGPH